jgi:hypothetical protein
MNVFLQWQLRVVRMKVEPYIGFIVWLWCSAAPYFRVSDQPLRHALETISHLSNFP